MGIYSQALGYRPYRLDSGAVMMANDIYESFDEMIALAKRKIELMEEMRYTLRVAELIGVEPKNMKEKGKITTATSEGGYPRMPWVGATFYVRIDGVKTPFPMLGVHHDLWPKDMLTAYKRHLARK